MDTAAAMTQTTSINTAPTMKHCASTSTSTTSFTTGSSRQHLDDVVEKIHRLNCNKNHEEKSAAPSRASILVSPSLSIQSSSLDSPLTFGSSNDNVHDHKQKRRMLLFHPFGGEAPVVSFSKLQPMGEEKQPPAEEFSAAVLTSSMSDWTPRYSDEDDNDEKQSKSSSACSRTSSTASRIDNDKNSNSIKQKESKHPAGKRALSKATDSIIVIIGADEWKKDKYSGQGNRRIDPAPAVPSKPSQTATAAASLFSRKRFYPHHQMRPMEEEGREHQQQRTAKVAKRNGDAWSATAAVADASSPLLIALRSSPSSSLLLPATPAAAINTTSTTPTVIPEILNALKQSPEKIASSLPQQQRQQYVVSLQKEDLVIFNETQGKALLSPCSAHSDVNAREEEEPEGSDVADDDDGAEDDVRDATQGKVPGSLVEQVVIVCDTKISKPETKRNQSDRKRAQHWSVPQPVRERNTYSAATSIIEKEMVTTVPCSHVEDVFCPFGYPLRTRVRKYFDGFGWFNGTLVHFDKLSGYYQIRFDDGDVEDFDAQDMQNGVRCYQLEKQSHRGKPSLLAGPDNNHAGSTGPTEFCQPKDEDQETTLLVDESVKEGEEDNYGVESSREHDANLGEKECEQSVLNVHQTRYRLNQHRDQISLPSVNITISAGSAPLVISFPPLIIPNVRPTPICRQPCSNSLIPSRLVNKFSSKLDSCRDDPWLGTNISKSETFESIKQQYRTTPKTDGGNPPKNLNNACSARALAWRRANTDPRILQGRRVFHKGGFSTHHRRNRGVVDLLGGQTPSPDEASLIRVVADPPQLKFNGRNVSLLEKGEFYVIANADTSPFCPTFPGDYGLMEVRSKEDANNKIFLHEQEAFHLFLQCSKHPWEPHYHGEDAAEQILYLGVYRIIQQKINRLLFRGLSRSAAFESLGCDTRLALADLYRGNPSSEECSRPGKEKAEHAWLLMPEDLQHKVDVCPVEFVSYDDKLYQALIDCGASSGQVSTDYHE